MLKIPSFISTAISLIFLFGCNSDDNKLTAKLSTESLTIKSNSEIKLDGSSSEGTIKVYNFHSSLDGLLCSSTSSICEHNFSTAGEHLITLELVGYNGEIDTEVITINVIDLNSTQINNLLLNGNSVDTNETPIAKLQILKEENMFENKGTVYNRYNEFVQIATIEETAYLSALNSSGTISNYTFKSSIEGTLCDSSSAICEHNFSTTGIHTIILLVKTVKGYTSVDYKSLIIKQNDVLSANTITASLTISDSDHTFSNEYSKDSQILIDARNSSNANKYTFFSSKDGRLKCSDNNATCINNSLTIGNHTIYLIVEDLFNNIDIAYQDINIS